MKTNVALRHVEVALQQRENGAFSGSRWAANSQHLSGLQREVHVFEHRMRRLRIAKRLNIGFHGPAPIGNGFAAVLHHRRFRQHRANTAVRGAAALNDVKHPRQRQHRPDHQPQIHGKTGQLTEGHGTLHHHPAPAANRQHIRHADGDIDRRVKPGVNTRHAHVFRAGIRRIGGKQCGLPVFQAEGFDHADAGHTLLGAIVER